MLSMCLRGQTGTTRSDSYRADLRDKGIPYGGTVEAKHEALSRAHGLPTRPLSIRVFPL
jgi:hypothetical protein